MLPANLTPLEVLDLAIHFEEMTQGVYERLQRRVEVPTLQAKLALLRKDEKDHRKTLRAHRRDLFGSAPPAAGREEAERIFGVVDVSDLAGKEALLRALHAAVKSEEYGTYYYERMKDRLPDRAARVFFEVLAYEGRFHADILAEQIRRVQGSKIAVDDRGRPVLAT